MTKSLDTRPNAVLFGQIIRRLRLARGWTIAQLARESEMHPNYLASMEKGGNTPSLDTILLLAIVFNADPAEWVREIAQQFHAEINARLASRGSEP
ncbi:MAG TPA: helix-turn-helix transcriptional regulator [Thermoanaerobaculia bacterium]|nr:helix-turn-helix transcriptional regulator [Thermoanaerobaculia bacterium]